MVVNSMPLPKVAYHIIFMINELHLLWVLNFIALRIYSLFGTKFSWNEETDTCVNVVCVLPGRNFDFLGGYMMVTARYLTVTTGYRSLLLVPTFIRTYKWNVSKKHLIKNLKLYIETQTPQFNQLLRSFFSKILLTLSVRLFSRIVTHRFFHESL